MRTRSALLIAAALAGVILAAGYSCRERGQLRGGDKTFAENAKLIALLRRADATLSIGERTKTADCSRNGPLPDQACTPGAIFADASPDAICVTGYTQTVRNVSVSLKAQIYAEYGLAYPQPSGAYEVDHLIPLELGGNNDAANLFPQPAEPVPGFHEKDLVENYLHNKVCAGEVGLAAAQKQIANDWAAIYDMLTTNDLLQLRQEIANWSG